MPLYKSEEGWRRFRVRTGNGHTARRAFMDARPSARLAATAYKPRKHERDPEEVVESGRMRGRRRVVIDS